MFLFLFFVKIYVVEKFYSHIFSITAELVARCFVVSVRRNHVLYQNLELKRKSESVKRAMRKLASE